MRLRHLTSLLLGAALGAMVMVSSAPPAVAKPQLQGVGVVEIIGITAAIVGTGAAVAALKSGAQPQIQIDHFSVAHSADFNVGDHGTINLRVTVDYGAIDDSLSGDETGTLKVEFFVDGKKKARAKEYATSSPTRRSYTFKGIMVGTRAGSSEVYAKLTLQGQTGGLIWDTWETVSQATETLNVDVAEPYTVVIVGPTPPEVPHGTMISETMRVTVRTEDYGEKHGWNIYAKLNGVIKADHELPAADDPGATKVLDLVFTPKSHGGCPYFPPHPQVFYLEFTPAEYRLKAYFSVEPYHYVQSGSLDPPLGPDLPLTPPCLDGQQYNPDTCQCETRGSPGTPVPPERR